MLQLLVTENLFALVEQPSNERFSALPLVCRAWPGLVLVGLHFLTIPMPRPLVTCLSLLLCLRKNHLQLIDCNFQHIPRSLGRPVLRGCEKRVDKDGTHLEILLELCRERFVDHLCAVLLIFSAHEDVHSSPRSLNDSADVLLAGDLIFVAFGRDRKLFCLEIRLIHGHQVMSHPQPNVCRCSGRSSQCSDTICSGEGELNVLLILLLI
mmetsp:Transcript_26948/g.88119  ORF Transcript_26948/g.88119 Transcript_26948/m.88119 type:complete len:209 (+) Transcript_26948:996-1622(+)